MKKSILITTSLVVASGAIEAKTLIAYYSYTNNIHNIVTELLRQIEADVIRIEPAEKGLDYAADNYAIGSTQIAAIRANPDEATSYPGIDHVAVDWDDYDTVIIGAPLWWSNMAAPLQTFLFENGTDMAGKNIALIVSSASSGISGVEADAKRLVPEGKHITPSLWVKSSQTSQALSLIGEWLQNINYEHLSSSVTDTTDKSSISYTVYSLSGTMLRHTAADISSLADGIYLINGKPTRVSHK